MPTRYQTILLFGPPGSGKGTQGKMLGQIHGFHHVSSGDIFRSVDVNSRLGKVFREYSTRGELVPDDVTIEMWDQNVRAQTVLSLYKPGSQMLVLDGIPRNPNQADLLKKHINVLKVIHLVCPDKEKMIERLRRRALKERRADDAKEEVIRRRWKVYEKETFPVLECYPARIIAEVNASGSPGGVLQRILAELVPVQEEHFKNPISG